MASVPDSKPNALPWIVAALAFLALFAMAAGRGFNARPSSTVDGSQNALPQAGLDDRGVAADEPGGGNVRAPDISGLSPQERADRLYNRVMLLASQGKVDSVQFFAPMALLVAVNLLTHRSAGPDMQAPALRRTWVPVPPTRTRATVANDARYLEAA